MNLQEMKVSELKEKAKALSIEGADAMKKSELIEAIEKVQPKGLLDKAKDAVSNLLHPQSNQDAQPNQKNDAENLEAPAAQESSDQISDLAKHPKFAKFKNTRGVN